eukprot:533481-Hanusia_phi.AAC.1
MHRLPPLTPWLGIKLCTLHSCPNVSSSLPLRKASPLLSLLLVPPLPPLDPLHMLHRLLEKPSRPHLSLRNDPLDPVRLLAGPRPLARSPRVGPALDPDASAGPLEGRERDSLPHTVRLVVACLSRKGSGVRG